MLRQSPWYIVVVALVVPEVIAGDAGPAPGRRASQEALKAYGALVGPWKGVGQPVRSSNKGAWTEKAEWVWKLSATDAALELNVERGKFVKSVLLRTGREPATFLLEATLADGSLRTFVGKAGAGDRLVLAAESTEGEGIRRITINPLHETRFLMLLESQEAGSPSFQRIAEVGYTRQGVAFAAGESYPLCIVTDGKGTIEVKHQGRSFWVCCSGCRELFEDDPAGVIAEAEARRKAKAR
jgi:hypothetical protein